MRKLYLSLQTDACMMKGISYPLFSSPTVSVKYYSESKRINKPNTILQYVIVFQMKSYLKIRVCSCLFEKGMVIFNLVWDE